MRWPWRLGIVLLAAAAALGVHGAAGQEKEQFTGTRTESAVLLKSPAGNPILRYVREHPEGDEPAPAVEGACYTYPLYTPSGEVVSDLAPKDQPHLRGVFCGWMQVEGERAGDWWGLGTKSPKEGRLVLNREARITEESETSTTLRVINSWRADGERVLQERVTITASQAAGCNVVDYDYKFTVPTRTEVVIGENAFGGFCYRARPRGQVEISGPAGKMNLPDSVSDKPESNWPSADWYDMTYRAADGKVSGVTVMDHPNNPQSTWHVTRALHLLNPSIVALGPVTIPFGEPLYLRYRLVVHDGAASTVDLPKLWEQFSEMD